MLVKDLRAQRVKNLPPYIFDELDQVKHKLISLGKDLIDLSVGDPDLMPSRFIINEFKKHLNDQNVYRYPPYQGTRDFCRGISDWYKKELKVTINPASEVWSLIGSKEGISHLVMALVNPGDTVLLPNPCFPMYVSSVILAGGKPYFMPLLKENNFLPDLASIKPAALRKAKLMLLNYPNNPTTAMATREFYREAIHFAGKHGIAICQDAAYNDIYFKEKPVSFLEMPGAKEVGVETRSFTKMFNVAGWRIGWLAGNARIVKAVGQLKTNVDSGLFVAFQRASIAALTKGMGDVERLRNIYEKRCRLLSETLRSIGWEAKMPEATFYLWVPVPDNNKDSMAFSKGLLKRTEILVTPGIGFGKYGEGYFRMSLTVSEVILAKTIQRLNKLKT
jgi:LL-diaminopimelate aminotransferase